VIQVYANDVLTYDSRLDGYELAGLKVTTALNKGGTAEIVMPPRHPAIAAYTEYSTIVQILRDGAILFRGRALYASEDVYRQRTIVCEGELCFLQDAITRPYLYQDSPAAIFAALIQIYNSQVEEQKRFQVGTVTVTDSNDYIRLESESAETVFDTLNKLLARCGGYIIFTTNSQGQRVINWYETPGYRSGQEINLDTAGNLLNLTRDGSNTNLATAIVPYGAKDETTGERVTIASVNGGLDYLVDKEAEALRGRITTTVTWDDVTEPTNLLRKAQQYLAEARQIVTSLRLTALDLSYIDKTIDSYRVGDTIHVRSKPHGVDDDFLLTERTEDLLNPAANQITLGKEQTSLTGANVAGDRQMQSTLSAVSAQVQRDFTANVTGAVQATESTLTSLIQQTSASVLLEVSQAYTTNDQLMEAVSTTMTQLENQFLFEFESLKATIDGNDADARAQFTEIYKYISFENGDIKLGASDSAVTLTLENDMIVFKKNGATFGWWDGVDFHTGNIVVEVNERAQLGDFAFVPRSNGSLSFLKVGG
jgi:phage minor structural protein